MAAGLPDRVDCMRLADEGAVLERRYALASLPRLQDRLAQATGAVQATFTFARAASGRAGARVQVQAVPQLSCQRCLQGFEYPLASSSDVEFSESEAESGDDGADAFAAPGGMVSLRELAEEEVLLALPIVAVCADPKSCARSGPSSSRGRDESETQRPFAELRNLMNRT